MFDLRHLRSFVTLAEELNFGRAARRLNLSQPPLSRQIRQLEEELGVELFVRTSRSVQLTDAGRTFHAEAGRLLQHCAEAVQTVRRVGRPAGGRVIIGFIGVATYSFIPAFVTAAERRHPEIKLDLKEMEKPEQLEALRAHRIDLALIRPQAAAAFPSVCVMRERLALAIPVGHPLARVRRPVPRQLDGEPFIAYSADAPYLNPMLAKALDDRKVRPNIVQSMSHSQAILALVSTGMGLAIVPAETRNACFDNIVFRPIDLGDDCLAEIHAAWNPANRNPVLPTVRDLAVSLFPSR